jgi:rubrerythrin
MGIKFNAAEIFDMAIRLEQNGANYYRKAAENFKEEGLVNLLNKLAGWEDGHKLTFSAMREDLASSDQTPVVFDPQGEVPLYLNALTDGSVFNVQGDPSKNLTGNEAPEDVLKTALLMEKDSIVFYLGLRELVPQDRGREKIDHIIQEEMGHIGYLNKELNMLKG